MRASGILMHITSLPDAYGIGTMGSQAYEFVDFLQKTGQRYWQILPLTPTGYGDSPYQSCSTFAGNPYLIDLQQLIEVGLLREEEVSGISWCEQPQRVDYCLLYQNRLAVLRLAYGRFQGSAEYEAFCQKNDSWLPDFALYMALKEKFQGLPWYQWERSLKFREPQALHQAKAELQSEIDFFSFVQFLFYEQWDALRSYAHEKGVAIIGDVPIYVPYDSVEVWKEPACFQLDENGVPTAIAGVPPDGFTKDGQLWGNPLYRWDAMQKDGYQWWLERLSAAGNCYDVVRFDHFRGLEAYWSVPYGDTTARNGRWVKGPGLDFVQTLQEKLPHIRFIAEDLGFLTPEVLELRDKSGFPGMKVLEFAFDSREPSPYLPHTYPKNSVCYTGTHDNMTMGQWLETASNEAVAYAKSYMCLNENEGLVWGAIRTAMASVSDLCIIPMQDYLNLGAEARMNCPGTMSGDNWTWRAEEDYLQENLAQRIFDMTKLYGRLGV